MNFLEAIRELADLPRGAWRVKGMTRPAFAEDLVWKLTRWYEPDYNFERLAAYDGRGAPFPFKNTVHLTAEDYLADDWVVLVFK